MNTMKYFTIIKNSIIPLLLFIICISTKGNVNSNLNNNDSISNADTAKLFAHYELSKLIDCPSTVKFPITYILPLNKKIICDSMIVFGPFDSQNLYGAMVRQYYFIGIKCKGNYHNFNNWKSFGSQIMNRKEYNDFLNSN